MKITKKDVQGIKRWLKDRRKSECPFDHVYCGGTLLRIGKYIGTEPGWYKCKRIFPTLKENHCPCYQFTDKHVVRRAKQVVEENA